MKKLFIVAAGFLFAGIPMSTGPTSARTQTSPQSQYMPSEPGVLAPPQSALQRAVNTVRIINTAEAGYKSLHGRYANWEELYRSGAIDKVESNRSGGHIHLAAGPGIIPGWDLALITSADGQKYDLSLQKPKDRRRFSFFSDERGLIYQGSVIGCNYVSMIPTTR